MQYAVVSFLYSMICCCVVGCEIGGIVEHHFLNFLFEMISQIDCEMTSQSDCEMTSHTIKLIVAFHTYHISIQK